MENNKSEKEAFKQGFIEGSLLARKKIKDAFAEAISETYTFGEPINWSTAQIEEIINKSL